MQSWGIDLLGIGDRILGINIIYVNGEVHTQESKDIDRPERMPNRVKGKSYLAGSDGFRDLNAEVICWRVLVSEDGLEVKCSSLEMLSIWVSQGISNEDGLRKVQQPKSTS